MYAAMTSGSMFRGTPAGRLDGEPPTAHHPSHSLPRMRLLALILLATAGATPALAQQSGLLLGLASDSGYRTLWIAPVDGKLAIAARHPVLIVPRDDGFHHVGVVHSCSITDYGEVRGSGPFVDDFDALVDRRVGSPRPAVDSGYMPCTDAASIVAVRRDSAARADSIALANAKTEADSSEATAYQADSDRCGFNTIHLTYVSSRYLSTRIESGTSEYCNPGRYTWSEERHTMGGDTAVALLPLLTPARAKSLTARWEREKGECAGESSPDESWGVVRGLGGWQLAFSTSGATACRGRSGNEETGFSIREPAPRAIAGRDPVAKWLQAARHVRPQLDDIFVSPSSDLVLVRVGSQMSAFVPQGGQLGPVRLEFALEPAETVVMAEWAMGAHVDRWTRELGAIHERW